MRFDTPDRATFSRFGFHGFVTRGVVKWGVQAGKPTRDLGVSRMKAAKFICSLVLSALCLFLLQSSNVAANAKAVYTLDGKQCSRQEYHGAEIAEEGHRYLNAGRYSEAADRLRRAASLAPRLGYIQSNLAFVLVKLGRAEEAIPYLKNAVRLDKNSVDNVRALSSAYVSCGRLTDASLVLNDFIQRHPHHAAVAEMSSYCGELRKELYAQSMADPVAAARSTDDYLAYATAEEGSVRWQFDRLPLKVYVAPGAGVIGYQPRFAGELTLALQTWEAATEGKVKFVGVSTPEQADITLSWTDNVKDLDSPDEGGEARVKFGSKGIVHSDIFVLTHNNLTGREHSADQIYGVCLHEIGHSLGLLNHSPDAHDIMFFSDRNANVRPQLSMRDRNTLNLLYQTAEAYQPRSGSSEELAIKRAAMFNEAVDDYNAARYEIAIQKCQALIKLDGSYSKATRLMADALDNQAAALIEKQDFVRAEYFAKSAYETRRSMGADADLGDTVYNYAIILRALHRDDEAARLEAELASTKISQN